MCTEQYRLAWEVSISSSDISMYLDIENDEWVAKYFSHIICQINLHLSAFILKDPPPIQQPETWLIQTLMHFKIFVVLPFWQFKQYYRKYNLNNLMEKE